MNRPERLAFAATAVLFAIFLVNIVLGAARVATVLSDVGEMLVLFGACIAFVIAVLMLERRESRSG